MEVTRKNFNCLLPDLEKTVADADFFSIDTEFTGLLRYNSINQYSSPSEYYNSVNEQTNEFIVIQFGLTAFYVPKTGDGGDAGGLETIKYKTFNFYLYPRAESHRFACQGGSLSFLASQNFDFNKLFADGISFCDIEEAARIRERHEARNLSRTTEEYNEVSVPVAEEKLLQQVSANVTAFLATDEQEIVVEKCNAFQRKLVYQLLEQKFAGLVSPTSRTLPNSNTKVIVVTRKLSAEAENKIVDEKLAKAKSEIDEIVGFTNFIKTLSDSKKLIVGHNMFLDILYTVRQFFNPNMSTLKEFKHSTHKMFPNLLDTKYMCTLDNLKSKITSSVLADILECVSKKPFGLPLIEPFGDEFAYSTETQKAHEAGFDSYMTGLAFIGMATYLNIKPTEMNGASPKLKNLINKLFIMRLADVCYISLTSKEPQPPRDHVFYITVPENWRHSNVVHHFRNYGPVFTSWIDSTSAFVSLQNREHAPIIEKSIGKLDGFTITSFAKYQLAKHGGLSVSNEEEPKRNLQQMKRKSPTEMPEEGQSSAVSKQPKTTRKQKQKARINAHIFPANDNWE